MPERIASGEPQEMGRHKRLHLTLKQETGSLRAQIGRFDAFRHSYNQDRSARGPRPAATDHPYRPSAAALGRSAA